jgi:hypothetical protein
MSPQIYRKTGSVNSFLNLVTKTGKFTYRNWGGNILDVGLFDENVSCFVSKVSDFILRKDFALLELLDLPV